MTAFCILNQRNYKPHETPRVLSSNRVFQPIVLGNSHRTRSDVSISCRDLTRVRRTSKHDRLWCILQSIRRKFHFHDRLRYQNYSSSHSNYSAISTTFRRNHDFRVFHSSRPPPIVTNIQSRVHPIRSTRLNPDSVILFLRLAASSACLHSVALYVVCVSATSVG